MGTGSIPREVTSKFPNFRGADRFGQAVGGLLTKELVVLYGFSPLLLVTTTFLGTFYTDGFLQTVLSVTCLFLSFYSVSYC